MLKLKIKIFIKVKMKSQVTQIIDTIIDLVPN